jgi:hypothetical protein
LIVGLFRFTGEPKGSNDHQKRSWSRSGPCDRAAGQRRVPSIGLM